MPILKVEITGYISLIGTMSLRDDLVENERAASDPPFATFGSRHFLTRNAHIFAFFAQYLEHVAKHSQDFADGFESLAIEEAKSEPPEEPEDLGEVPMAAAVRIEGGGPAPKHGVPGGGR